VTLQRDGDSVNAVLLYFLLLTLLAEHIRVPRSILQSSTRVLSVFGINLTELYGSCWTHSAQKMLR